MSVLDPLTHVLASVVAGAHAGRPPSAPTRRRRHLAALHRSRRGRRPHGAAAADRPWRASGTCRGPRETAPAQARRALPRPQGCREPAGARRRAPRPPGEHGVSPWGCLPLLAQVPIWWRSTTSLRVAARGGCRRHGGRPGGIARGGDRLGVPLGRPRLPRRRRGARPRRGRTAATAALLGYVTQRFFVAPNTRSRDLPERSPGAARRAVVSAGRAARRGRLRAGRAARLLGVQRDVDARAVGGRRRWWPTPQVG